MALQLTKEMDDGNSGNYWKVMGMSLVRSDDKAIVTLALYKDSDARQAEKQAMTVRQYTLSGFDITSMDAGNPVALAYTKLKELDEFSTATDV